MSRETRLNAWANGRIRQPFIYGVIDCAILAFEAVDLQAGTRLADTWRGEYSDEASAVRLMIRRRTHIKLEMERAGLASVVPGFQQPGDIIIAEDLATPEKGVKKRLWDRLGIGFLHSHVCLGAKSLSADAVSGVVALLPTHAIVESPGHRAHIFRVMN